MQSGMRLIEGAPAAPSKAGQQSLYDGRPGGRMVTFGVETQTPEVNM